MLILESSQNRKRETFLLKCAPAPKGRGALCVLCKKEKAAFLQAHIDAQLHFLLGVYSRAKSVSDR